MKDIRNIDRNLAITSTVNGKELSFFDTTHAPFRIYGLLREDMFIRIPQALAASINEGVEWLNHNTAGGRLRFRTDSPIIALRTKMPAKCLMSHMPFTGSSGFDLYVTEVSGPRYAGSFIPPIDRKDSFESFIELPGKTTREITINFPLYDAVENLFIGISPDAVLEPCTDYRNDTPILYYGSSITQGGCASRPGNCYQSIISRRFNCDYVNLGWSGSAKGEQSMADYIAAHPMCLFFMDYDHNAPTPEHLRATHERLFLTVREKNPDLPIILASKTDVPRSPTAEADTETRRAIIRETYENALARGDHHVAFIDGGQVFSEANALNIRADSCTVDGCHPNDLGFACMAKVFGDKIGHMMGWGE